ncbi:MAG: hypothetical protein JXR73_16500 [Candidatus Omnitrophica bacterium]|nr:hypothetical protein [Candidatus Omnitrophota bacterium]
MSVLRGGSYEVDPLPRWHRRSELFFPFLMIFVFFVILFVAKMAVQVQNSQVDPSEINSEYSQPAGGMESDEEEMTYEEAKSIFGG